MKGIYKITNKSNGKVYIGESLNIIQRWSEHLNTLREGSHHNFKLQNEFNCHGEKCFEFEILLVLDESISDYMCKYIGLIYEERYITKFNSIKEGYNITNSLKDIMNSENKKIGMNTDFKLDVYNNCKKNLRNNVYREFGGVIFLDSTYKDKSRKTKKSSKVTKENANTPSQVLKLKIETWLDGKGFKYEVHKSCKYEESKVFYLNYYFVHNGEKYGLSINYKDYSKNKIKEKYASENDIKLLIISPFSYDVENKLNDWCEGE